MGTLSRTVGIVSKIHIKSMQLTSEKEVKVRAKLPAPEYPTLLRTLPYLTEFAGSSTGLCDTWRDEALVHVPYEFRNLFAILYEW